MDKSLVRSRRRPSLNILKYVSSTFHNKRKLTMSPADPSDHDLSNDAANVKNAKRDAERLSNYTDWKALLRRVLIHFPHVIPQRRLVMDQAFRSKGAKSQRRIILAVSSTGCILSASFTFTVTVQVYHPDKNGDVDDEWKEVYGIITRVLTAWGSKLKD